MRLPMGVISCISALRVPSFSMTAPTLSAGTSTTRRSIGSHFLPSMVWYSTRGGDTWNSYPSRRIVSIRMDRLISPRPATLKASMAPSISLTRRDTSFSVSRNSRSRSWRLVTNLPSRPAKGLSLTEKVISTVGALIFTKGSGSTQSGAQMVSPMVISPMPLRAMMLPAVASVMGTLPRPANSYMLTALAFLAGASGSW